LWKATSPDYFDLNECNQRDVFGAVHEKILAETLTRVLYPDDARTVGRHLRFLQEYFLVACSLADIVRRFRGEGGEWSKFADRIAIQLDDTHPAMAVAELMRRLLDDARLGWDQSWELTVRTFAYTNHTLLPEALDRGPVELFELAVPRHLDIIYEINRRFIAEVRARFPCDEGGIERMRLIEERPVKSVRMANLAVVGAHSTNGVSESHSDLFHTCRLKHITQMLSERLCNETNGVGARHGLLAVNPELAEFLTESSGDEWISDLDTLRALLPLAQEAAFRPRFRGIKRAAKARIVDWLKATQGRIDEPDSIFDCQIKRIHEYKRQLLNALRIIILDDRLAARGCHARRSVAHVVRRGEGGTVVCAGEAPHHVDQQRRRGDQCRSDYGRPDRGGVSRQLRRHLGAARDPGERRVGADLHCGLRGERCR
jgi:starch phosphorylase